MASTVGPGFAQASDCMPAPLRSAAIDIRLGTRPALVFLLGMLITLLLFGRAAHAQTSSLPPSVDPAFAAALWMSSAAVASAPPYQPLTLDARRGPRVLAAGLGFMIPAAIGLATFGRQIDPCDYGSFQTPKATRAVGSVTLAIGALMTFVGAYKMGHQPAAQRTGFRASRRERAKAALIGAFTGVLATGAVGSIGFFENICWAT
jgi:hypothetical protein